jgi:Homeodomain-like domain
VNNKPSHNELFAPQCYREREDRLTVEQLAEVCGPEAAAALAAAFGGTRLYLALQPTPDSEIARAIGLEAARKIGARHGGEVIEIPLIKSRAQRHKDRAQIVELREQGLSIPAIARRVRCSMRHVYNVLAAERDS